MLDGTDDAGTPASTLAHNSAEVPAMVDAHREHFASTWAAQQPATEDLVAVWFVSCDGCVNGVGSTTASAWASAFDAAVLAAAADDSARHAGSVHTLDAKFVADAGRHRLTQVSFAGGGVDAVRAMLDVVPGGRVYGLILAAAAGDRA